MQFKYQLLNSIENCIGSALGLCSCHSTTIAHLEPSESTKKSHLYFLNLMLFICPFFFVFVLLFLFAFQTHIYSSIVNAKSIQSLECPFFRFILDIRAIFFSLFSLFCCSLSHSHDKVSCRFRNDFSYAISTYRLSNSLHLYCGLIAPHNLLGKLFFFFWKN